MTPHVEVAGSGPPLLLSSSLGTTHAVLPLASTERWNVIFADVIVGTAFLPSS